MKDENDRNTHDLLSGDQRRQSDAERQARLKARRAADGWKRKTVWVHEESRLDGVAAGEGANPCEPAKAGASDYVSWVIGWDSAKKK